MTPNKSVSRILSEHVGRFRTYHQSLARIVEIIQSHPDVITQIPELKEAIEHLETSKLALKREV
jgi:hypothetical protein